MSGRLIYFCIIIILLGINNKFLHYLLDNVKTYNLGSMKGFHHQHSVHHHHHHLPQCLNKQGDTLLMPHELVISIISITIIIITILVARRTRDKRGDNLLLPADH